MEPRSILPGRERWRFRVDEGAEEGAEDVAASAQRYLTSYSGVQSVLVNSRIGGVLLIFDPDLAQDGDPLLLQVLRMVERELPNISLLPSREGSAVRDSVSLLVPTTALLVAGVAALAVLIPATYLVGVAVLAASYTIAEHYWSQSRWSGPNALPKVRWPPASAPAPHGSRPPFTVAGALRYRLLGDLQDP